MALLGLEQVPQDEVEGELVGGLLYLLLVLGDEPVEAGAAAGVLDELAEGEALVGAALEQLLVAPDDLGLARVAAADGPVSIVLGVSVRGDRSRGRGGDQERERDALESGVPLEHFDDLDSGAWCERPRGGLKMQRSAATLTFRHAGRHERWRTSTPERCRSR